jgi:hypothetical protein
MKRHIEPEWLDDLAADDPRAIRSRRDLRRVNGMMGNVRVIEAALRKTFYGRPPGQIVDLGAGDGTLMLRVARRLSAAWRNVHVSMVDRKDIVSAETRRRFATLSWKVNANEADVFDWLARSSCPHVDLVTANLFLHHFSGASLSRLMRLAAERTDCFVACEPRRYPVALRASRWLWVIGCNAVTRHDAMASVQAGFAGDELSALWPANGGWQLREEDVGLFSHCFTAQRSSARQPPGNG